LHTVVKGGNEWPRAGKISWQFIFQEHACHLV
jgi:hypothetical protein